MKKNRSFLLFITLLLSLNPIVSLSATEPELASKSHFSSSTSSMESSKISEISILIPSCDKYAEAWPPFFQLLFKYWPELKDNQQPIYLISQSKTFDKTFGTKKITPIQISPEISWSDNMVIALEKIEAPYIMIILEDYFFTNPVKLERLQQLFTQMKKEKAGYISLVNLSGNRKPHPSIPGLGILQPDAEYRTALQISIWDKKVLKDILKKGENPWSFETEGTIRSRHHPQAFWVVEANQPIDYIGAIDRGHWNARGLALLEKENLMVDFQLPKDNVFRKWLRDHNISFARLDRIFQKLKNKFQEK